MNEVEFQKLLQQELSVCQMKNSSYSIRAFAKKLGVGSGTLSQVLAGKRVLAKKSVIRVLDRLGTSPTSRAKVLKEKKSKPIYEQTLLHADQYFVLSEWYYLAILSLVRTHDFESTPEHISARLGISKAMASQALDRLERLQLLKSQNGKLIRTQTAFKTSDGIPSGAIRKAHVTNLELAQKSLNDDPFESADFSFITLAFDREQMPEAKKRIREMQNEFSEEFSTSANANEVYRMGVQFFSLTKNKQNKKEKQE